MTEEMIKSITDAETQAAEIKQAAMEKSAQILAEAEERAVGVEKSCDMRLKSYRETELKNAKAAAEVQYSQTLADAEKNARVYCANVLKNAETCVSEIVGRIVRGDC